MYITVCLRSRYACMHKNLSIPTSHAAASIAGIPPLYPHPRCDNLSGSFPVVTEREREQDTRRIYDNDNIE